MTDLVIETRGLVRRFGTRHVLDGLDLALPPGGIHAVVGGNGAGKSTLFRILLGFLSATAGEARILGRDSRTLGPKDRGRIGFVNEDHSLPAWMQVDALIRMQRSHHARWDEPAFRAVIDSVRIDPRQEVRQLSRGERAGLGLALVLGQAPELVILDEPTLGLDVVARRTVLEAVVAASAAQRSTIVYCSHQIDEIERLADNLVLLDAGRALFVASPDEVRARVRLWLADIPFRGPDPSALPGLLDVQQLDGVHHYLVLGQGDEFAAVLRAAGARSIRSMPVSLDRAISGVLARRSARHA
jgi:ABC-2 type transport system ATP-binding protein